jgi:hypothetical protein
VSGNYIQIDGHLAIQLSGVDPGTTYDRLQVTGNIVLGNSTTGGGTLDVSFVNGFTPAAGNSFDILDGASTSGTFDTLSLPSLAPGLMWNVSKLYTTGVLRVYLTGDYNGDGVVDAADYTVWRDTLGQSGTALAADGNGNGTIDAGDFDVWTMHFGEHAGSGSAASASAVPEPTSLWLLLLGILANCFRQRAMVS